MTAAWLKAAVADRRLGLKGPRAAEVLEQAGFNVPARANTWAPLRAQDRDDSPNLVARLGNTEFFVEHLGEIPETESLEALSGVAGAYPVLHEDTALVLGGPAANEVLLEVCNVDFTAQDLARNPVIMTFMTGVGVLVLPQASEDGLIFRIWCDPSFGSYLHESLEDVMQTINGRSP